MARNLTLILTFSLSLWERAGVRETTGNCGYSTKSFGYHLRSRLPDNIASGATSSAKKAKSDAAGPPGAGALHPGELKGSAFSATCGGGVGSAIT